MIVGIIGTLSRGWINRWFVIAYQRRMRIQLEVVDEYMERLKLLMNKLHHGPPISNFSTIVGLISLAHNHCPCKETLMAWEELEKMLVLWRQKLREVDSEVSEIDLLLKYVKEYGILVNDDDLK